MQNPRNVVVVQCYPEDESFRELTVSLTCEEMRAEITKLPQVVMRDVMKTAFAYTFAFLYPASQMDTFLETLKKIDCQVGFVYAPQKPPSLYRYRCNSPL